VTERTRPLRPGDVVRWNPPNGVYGPNSLQTRLAGQTGVIRPHHPGSDYLPVRFERKTLFLNPDYLELL
jgi:hypothetical protein